MGDWQRYEHGLHSSEPLWVKFYGNGLSATAYERPAVGGRHLWYLADSTALGAKTYRRGFAESVETAKFAADTAAHLVRISGRGRRSIEQEGTTSTERNRMRMERLLATESMARELIGRLTENHRNFMAAGQSEAAEIVAFSLRAAALKGLADYTRRMTTFRVRSGQQMATPAEWETYEAEVTAVADDLEKLADDTATNKSDVEEAVDRLKRLGVYADAQLLSAIIQSFQLGPKQTYYAGARLPSAVNKLRRARVRLQAAGIEHATIFGSVARGDDRPNSDLDIAIDVKPNAYRTIGELGVLIGQVDGLFPGAKVDVVVKSQLSADIAAAVEEDGVNAF